MTAGHAKMRDVRRRLLVALSLVVSLLAARTARADYETWIWTETRVPLIERAERRAVFPRTTLRLWTDTRFNGRSGGLAQQFVRVGPLVDVTSWMFVGVHGVIYADRTAAGAFQQEARAELEPNLYTRIGDFTFADRNRLEYRWRDSGERFRYRNQLRASYAPAGSSWIPFVWDELLVDLSGAGVNQNRATLGLGRKLWEGTRLDAGVMLRSRRETTGWEHDRVLVMYLLLELDRPRAAQ